MKKFVLLIIIILLFSGCHINTAISDNPEVPDVTAEIEFKENEWLNWEDNWVDWEHFKSKFEVDFANELQIDFSFAGKPITTKDQALKTAYTFSETLNEIAPFPYNLAEIDYDTKENIWIFVYIEKEVGVLGKDFCVAVKGENSEVFLIWTR